MSRRLQLGQREATSVGVSSIQAEGEVGVVDFGEACAMFGKRRIHHDLEGRKCTTLDLIICKA